MNYTADFKMIFSRYKFLYAGFALLAIAVTAIYSGAEAQSVLFPSSNSDNKKSGNAYVELVDVYGQKTAALRFISTKWPQSCFEYRADGNASDYVSSNHPAAELDRLYESQCVSNNSSIIELDAHEYVEVRLAQGDNPDEWFDWVRFDVADKRDAVEMSSDVEAPQRAEISTQSRESEQKFDDEYSDYDNDEEYFDKNDCKRGGWRERDFRNQGQCVSENLRKYREYYKRRYYQRD